jgi:hypothetical protein
MNTPSTLEISTNYDLWMEYVSPGFPFSREEFDSLTVTEKNEIQRKCFPDECDDLAE